MANFKKLCTSNFFSEIRYIKNLDLQIILNLAYLSIAQNIKKCLNK